MRISIYLPLVSGLITLLTSCQSPMAIRADSLIVVKDVSIPKGELWVARFAKHTFVDYRADVKSSWRRIEIVNSRSGILHHTIDDKQAHSPQRWGERVHVLSQSDGSQNPHFVRDIALFAKEYDQSVYRVWPGPNSNTFAEKLCRKIKGIDANLHHNAVGKEHGFYIGKTAGGTGVELQTPIVGASLGLREGVEVNIIGLSAGVSISPFRVKIPFLP